MHNKAHAIYNTDLAHRGLHNNTADENSMAAFKLAVENGFGIELDVHVTKDNYVVVMHDLSTLRTTGIDLKLTEVNYEDLNEVKLLITKENIPLLKDVLTMVDGKVPVLIELKAENNVPDNLVSEVIKVVDEFKHHGNLAVQAFNPYVVKNLKKAKIGVPVGQLMSDNLPGQSKFVHFMYRSLLVLSVSKPDFFNYEVKYIAKRRIQRRRKRIPLITWTIDTDEKYNYAQKYADNCIFELIDIKKE